MPLKDDIDRQMWLENEKFLSTVPGANYLTDPRIPLNDKYYLRHRIETIRRIRMTARTDALALASLVREDYEGSRFWARYTADELCHDLLFSKDLAEHGVTKEMILGIPPFPSTLEMLRFLESGIERDGALPALVYSLFVEWNSMRFSGKAVRKVEKHYSGLHVRGSSAHLHIDESEDHYSKVLGIVEPIVQSRPRRVLLENLIGDIASFFRAYFHELYAETCEESRVPVKFHVKVEPEPACLRPFPTN
ncbi:MAG TPA: hypothetical protein VJ385_01515 [Fibrobacteria bacterium]|nr:hypothetical protein [Fibrobacteria bacterium]